MGTQKKCSLVIAEETKISLSRNFSPLPFSNDRKKILQISEDLAPTFLLPGQFREISWRRDFEGQTLTHNPGLSKVGEAVKKKQSNENLNPCKCNSINMHSLLNQMAN